MHFLNLLLCVDILGKDLINRIKDSFFKLICNIKHLMLP